MEPWWTNINRANSSCWLFQIYLAKQKRPGKGPINTHLIIFCIEFLIQKKFNCSCDFAQPLCLCSQGNWHFLPSFCYCNSMAVIFVTQPGDLDGNLLARLAPDLFLLHFHRYLPCRVWCCRDWKSYSTGMEPKLTTVGVVFAAFAANLYSSVVFAALLLPAAGTQSGFPKAIWFMTEMLIRTFTLSEILFGAFLPLCVKYVTSIKLCHCEMGVA